MSDEWLPVREGGVWEERQFDEAFEEGAWTVGRLNGCLGFDISLLIF
jgi:hypothetical protein